MKRLYAYTESQDLMIMKVKMFLQQFVEAHRVLGREFVSSTTKSETNNRRLSAVRDRSFLIFTAIVLILHTKQGSRDFVKARAAPSTIHLRQSTIITGETTSL
jgi:hypothetical protein